MLAARDQENLAHGFKAAAAAKPLNQDAGSLASRTPGNATFNGHSKATGRNRGDENAPLGLKSVGGKSNAFVTPAAPRSRAPLGAKTTNAKVKAFQTPAPATLPEESREGTKLRSTSVRKPKLKIHRAEPVEADLKELNLEEGEEPEVEYCPPKITELPDTPDEEWAWGPKTFECLEGANLTRGWYDCYVNPVGEDGLTLWQREQMVKNAESDERDRELLTREADASLAQLEARVYAEAGPSSSSYGGDAIKPSIHGPSKSVSQRKNASTLDSRNAAQALSQKPAPRFAAPTAATMAKKTAVLPTAPVSVAASRMTIGHARGRKVSAALRQERKEAAREEHMERVQSDKRLMDQLLSSKNHGDESEDEDDLLFPKYSFNVPSTGSPIDDDFEFTMTPIWG